MLGGGSIETNREGNTETLSTFLSSLQFFRVNRFLWCSSLPRRLPLGLNRCVGAETFSPCLSLHVVLQYDISETSRIGSDGCIHPEDAVVS